MGFSIIADTTAQHLPYMSSVLSLHVLTSSTCHCLPPTIQTVSDQLITASSGPSRWKHLSADLKIGLFPMEMLLNDKNSTLQQTSVNGLWEAKIWQLRNNPQMLHILWRWGQVQTSCVLSISAVYKFNNCVHHAAKTTFYMTNIIIFAPFAW